LAVVATLSKGCDLDYIWRQVDRSATGDAAGYYIQATERGGEPPGRWRGPGAKALGLEQGQLVERGPYDLLFGERKTPDGTQLGRPPGSGRNAADVSQLPEPRPQTRMLPLTCTFSVELRGI
jgi:TrwC relaxase